MVITIIEEERSAGELETAVARFTESRYHFEAVPHEGRPRPALPKP